MKLSKKFHLTPFLHKNGLLTGGLLGLSLLVGSAQATLIDNMDGTVTR